MQQKNCKPLASFLLIFVLVLTVLAAEDQSAASESLSSLAAPTHRQVNMIYPTINGKKQHLHTFATTPDGEIVACVGQKTGTVLLLNRDGRTLRQWNPGFVATAVTVAPDGAIFVGGGGVIAQLGASGDVLKKMDSPNFDGDMAALKARTVARIKSDHDEWRNRATKAVERIQSRIDMIESKPEEERTRVEQASLPALRKQLETGDGYYFYTQGDMLRQLSEASIQRTMEQAIEIVSMAASGRDVFLCAEDPEGGLYGVWRVDRELNRESSQLILERQYGCCGQMDIQCRNDQLIVSANTHFRVRIHDRDGQQLSEFGSKDRTGKVGFGSCCNPMNSLPLADGSIVTAESSIGYLKQFDTDGNLLSYVGNAQIGSGCKHCSIGRDEKSDIYFLMYEDESAIWVLAPKDSKLAIEAAEKLKTHQAEFLAKATGTWKAVAKKRKNPNRKQQTKAQGTGANSGAAESLEPAPLRIFSELRIDADGQVMVRGGDWDSGEGQARIVMLPSNELWEEQLFSIEFNDGQSLDGSWTFQGGNDNAVVVFGSETLRLQMSAGNMDQGKDE